VVGWAATRSCPNGPNWLSASRRFWRPIAWVSLEQGFRPRGPRAVPEKCQGLTAKISFGRGRFVRLRDSFRSNPRHSSSLASNVQSRFTANRASSRAGASMEEGSCQCVLGRNTRRNLHHSPGRWIAPRRCTSAAQTPRSGGKKQRGHRYRAAAEEDKFSSPPLRDNHQSRGSPGEFGARRHRLPSAESPEWRARGQEVGSARSATAGACVRP
jgi:hypothetical protein